MATRIVDIGVLTGVANNNFDCAYTQNGAYAMVVRQGAGVTILHEGASLRSFDVPQIHNGKLGVIDGELVVDYAAFLGSLPGTERDNPDRPWRRFYTGIQSGPLVGSLNSGNLPPEDTHTGEDMATVDLAPIAAKIDQLSTAVDQLHTDVVGRLKAHDATENDRIGALGAMIAKVPAEVVGEVPAGDHFGLDPRAQFNNVWQELLVYPWAARQDTIQVFVERFFEACRNMDKEGFDWQTGKYDLPKK